MIHIYAYRQGGYGPDEQPVFQSVPSLKVGLAQMAATQHKEASHGEKQYIEFCDAPCERCRGELKGWNGAPGSLGEWVLPIYRGLVHKDGSNRPYVEVSTCLVASVEAAHGMWFGMAIECGLYGNILTQWLHEAGVRLSDGVVPYLGQNYPFAIEPVSGGDQWRPPVSMRGLESVFRELVLTVVLNIRKD